MPVTREGPDRSGLVTVLSCIRFGPSDRHRLARRLEWTARQRHRPVVGGVDTHKDLHVAAVVDDQDRVLGTRSFPTTRQGYRQMLAWMRDFGPVLRIGVESTGSYGAGLLRSLPRAGVEVLEVIAPDRQDRRRRGKNDDLDAENAAHAAFAGQRTVTPRTRDGMVGISQGSQGLPEDGRSCAPCRAPDDPQYDRLRAGSPSGPAAPPDPDATRPNTRSLAPRSRCLSGRRRRLPHRPQIPGPPIPRTARRDRRPRRHDRTDRRRVGAGPDRARLHRIHLRGPASAHRRRQPGAPEVGGQLRGALRGKPRARLVWQDSPPSLEPRRCRTANSALHIIAICRPRTDPRTQDYVARRIAAGHSRLDAIRALKRYIAREVFSVIARRQKEISQTRSPA